MPANIPPSNQLGANDMTTEQKETLIGWLGLALLVLPFIIL